MTRHEYQLWGAKATCKRGEQLPQSRLTESVVRSIRADMRPARIVAAELGMHVRTIEAVRQRLRWGHVR